MKHLKTFETEKPKYWAKEELQELVNKYDTRLAFKKEHIKTRTIKIY